MRVVSNGVGFPRHATGVDPPSGARSTGEPAEPATLLTQRLETAVRASQVAVARSSTACREAAAARVLAVRARARRRDRSRRRSGTARRALPPPGPRAQTVDPLTTTITVARACDQLSGIEFYDAGRRSGAPRLELAGLAAVGPSPGDQLPAPVRESTPAPGENGHGCLESECGARLRIYVTSRRGRRLVRLVGELDLLDASRVRAVLAEDDGCDTVLDLTDLRFVDAAGVASIVAASRSIGAAGHELTVRGTRGIVRRVFEITELGHLLGD